MEKDIEIASENICSTTAFLVNLRELDLFLSKSIDSKWCDEKWIDEIGKNLEDNEDLSFEYPFLYQVQRQMKEDSVQEKVVINYTKKKRKVNKIQLALGIELFVGVACIALLLNQNNNQQKEYNENVVGIEESHLGR